jgi:hypothetical protein
VSFRNLGARARPVASLLVGGVLGASLAAAVSEAYAAEGEAPPLRAATVPMVRVHVESSDCPLAPLDDVLTVLRVEIPARLTDEASLTAYSIAIDCGPDAVRITASTPAQGTRTTRMALGGAPPSLRARIVALAIAETVDDLDREAAQAPSPPVEPQAHAAQPALDGDASTRRSLVYRRVHTGAFAQTSTFRLDSRWLTGGGLRFESSAGHLCTGIDTVILSDTQSFGFGTAQSLLVYSSPYAAWAVNFGDLGVKSGVGYALGAARLSGHATAPRFTAATVAGPWTAPYGFAALSLAVTEGLRAEARAQAGWVTSTVVGEVTGGGDVHFEGLWASAQIGLALGL